ncbi:MAG: HEAT repeat domain-containing protein [Woeseiaceae bacterium]
MKSRTRIFFVLLALMTAANGWTQDDAGASDDSEALKLAALEALIAAPPERALPLATKVLAGNHSKEVKARALFVLSQIDDPAAQQQLIRTAEQNGGELQAEAIRMVGIGGNEAALARLAGLYRSGDEATRRAVLEAYMIAGDVDGVFEIARNTESEADFEHAVNMLAAMGAHDELRQLRATAGLSSSLINAYGISGDVDSLLELVRDGSNPEQQAQAIQALAIAGTGKGEDVTSILRDAYRNSDTQVVRDAALQGLIIVGDDETMLQLYRTSDSAAEKRQLMQALAATGSDRILEIIDEALAEQ